MKYKTLFRVLLKVIGVWFLAQGTAEFGGHLAWEVAVRVIDADLDLGILESPFRVQAYVLTAMKIIVGLYLFFGGRGLADLVIPNNRDYCPECSYPITSHQTDNCPECGATTRQTSELNMASTSAIKAAENDNETTEKEPLP